MLVEEFLKIEESENSYFEILKDHDLIILCFLRNFLLRTNCLFETILLMWFLFE